MGFVKEVPCYWRYIIYYLGSLFLVLVIIQHVGGVASFLGRKKNPQHRAFGKLLVNIGRAVAAVGWLLTGKV
jgi:hypothetical protein